jgi:threonine aldolase
MPRDDTHDTHPGRPGIVDLRSDTVTQPTPEMRHAMAAAPVGDDLLGEDPTVARLESLAARILGKKAALFLPSGSMANLAAIIAHTGGPAEILAEERAHILQYEGGSHATIAGCPARALRSERGVYHATTLKAELRPALPLFARQRLVCIENTSVGWGGTVWPLDAIEPVAHVAREHDLRLHCDGARLFNAAVALKTEAARLVAPCDSVMVSLSKGLSAPVGSILAGTEDLINAARHARKALGGAMRQSGVIAAAGVIALETMRDRLHEDHQAARRLAEGLHAAGYGVDPDAHPTNIVFIDPTARGFPDAAACAAAMAKEGVLAFAEDPATVRLVTHRHITPPHVERALDVLSRLRP